MPGPRDYRQGARIALATLSGGTCYFPGCERPIVVFLDGDDEPYVDCQIAHIKDAKPGNRYDPNMSDEERRSFPNLILLCKPHHDLVDKRRPDDYASETLAGWKAEVERDISSEEDLTELSEDEVEQELVYGAVVAKNSRILLGGKGGSAPGAGGGGGGAIGGWATGGRGGRGGDTYLDGSPGSAPGAGGGGAGAIGPDARGGDGGGGGEAVIRCVELGPDIAGMRIRVGRGGRAVPGGPGEDGEDSVVEVVRKDGTVAETIKAAGGKGGAPGMPGVPAEVVTAILCNAADMREGLLYVLGAGWNSVKVPELPADIRGVLVISAQSDEPGVGQLQAKFVDASDLEVISTTATLEFAEQTDVRRVNCILPFSIRAECTGLWSVVVMGKNTITLPFQVIEHAATSAQGRK